MSKDVEDVKQEIKATLEKATAHLQDTIPPLSDERELLKDPEGLRRELAEYTNILSKNSRYLSEVYSDRIKFRQLSNRVQEECGPALQRQFREFADPAKNQFKDVVDALKYRIRNIKQIIDSLRSLQTHASSQPNF